VIQIWKQPEMPLFDFEPIADDVLIWFDTQHNVEYIFNVTRQMWLWWYSGSSIEEVKSVG
jgi:hypothetical protein